MPVDGPGFDAECIVKPATFVLLNTWAAKCGNVEPPRSSMPTKRTCARAHRR
jgi:hypothetical protein